MSCIDWDLWARRVLVASQSVQGLKIIASIQDRNA